MTDEELAITQLADPDPVVRVTAALAVLRQDVPWDWLRALNEAILTDLPAAVRRLGLDGRPWDLRPGTTWAELLHVGDHDDECRRLVRLLLAADDHSMRWIGLDLASASVRLWPTQAVRLATALVANVRDSEGELRAETLRVLRLDPELWRVADEAFAVGGDRVSPADPGAGRIEPPTR